MKNYVYLANVRYRKNAKITRDQIRNDFEYVIQRNDGGLMSAVALLARHTFSHTQAPQCDCAAGMYFLFVVLFCAASLTASIAVMYVHDRSSGTEDSLAMPTWVRLSAKFRCFGQ